MVCIFMNMSFPKIQHVHIVISRLASLYLDQDSYITKPNVKVGTKLCQAGIRFVF